MKIEIFYQRGRVSAKRCLASRLDILGNAQNLGFFVVCHTKIGRSGKAKGRPFTHARSPQLSTHSNFQNSHCCILIENVYS